MTVVLAHGVFDVLHPGHLAFLIAARSYGDHLVVSITADEYVRRQKGKGHPHFPAEERKAMLRALRVVDDVVISEAEDAEAVIRYIRPVFYVKGNEYAAGDPSGRLKREREAVESIGGHVIFIATSPRYSSSAILRALA